MQFPFKRHLCSGSIDIPNEVYFDMSPQETVLADISFTSLKVLPNSSMDIVILETLHKIISFEIHSEESRIISTKLLLGLPVTITKEVKCTSITNYDE